MRRPISFLLSVVFILPLAACRGCRDGGEKPPTNVASAAEPATGGGGAAPQAAPTTVASLPDGPWRDLARRLVSANDLRSAVGVTREVLARGGVGTFNGQRNIVDAHAPVARVLATPVETVYLAMEARRRPTAGRLSAAELAQMLQGLGFPFGGRTVGPDDRATRPLRQQLADDMEEAIQEERQGESRARVSDQRAARAAEDAAREENNRRDAELVERIREAGDAWNKARQAASKAAPADKAAAEARVKEAWDARAQAIEARNAARQQARQAQQDARDRARARDDEERRWDRARSVVGPDYAAGEQLLEMFRVWVNHAAQNPDDPRSFTPLFLAEMARLQDPPFDLLGDDFSRPGRGDGPPVDLRGVPRSQQLRLTLLEVQLIAAAFYRSGEPARASIHRWPGSIFTTIVHAQDPCSDFKKTLGDLGEILQAGASEAVGQGLDAAVDAATGGGDGFGNAMAALGFAAKIGKLAAFYDDKRITVSAPVSTHKPPEGPAIVTYTATAGISEEEWNEIQNAMNAEGATVDRAMRDCFNSLGLPTQPDLSDLAKEAENWLVEWRLTEGAPEHAWITLKNNKWYLVGRLAMKLERSGPYSASAKLNVDIHPEREPSGKIIRAYVTSQASLDAAGMPSLSTLLNALKGGLGLADSILELCAGWYQFMNMPKAYATVEVEYHCPKPTTRHPGNAVADGGADQGPQDCVIPGSAR